MTETAKRVLVVDDSSLLRGMVADLLRADGLQVDAAANGRDAIARLGAGGPLPDIILIDLLMPEVDGYELLQFLEGTPHLTGIPVIVVTVLQQPPLPGGIPVLRKPLDSKLLRRVVQACLTGPTGGHHGDPDDGERTQ